MPGVNFVKQLRAKVSMQGPTTRHSPDTHFPAFLYEIVLVLRGAILLLWLQVDREVAESAADALSDWKAAKLKVTFCTHQKATCCLFQQPGSCTWHSEF